MAISTLSAEAAIGPDLARLWKTREDKERFKWSSLGLLTPATVHHGQAEAALAARQAVLTAAYALHPERFVCRPPRPLALPSEVWINPPADGPEPRMLQLPRDTNSEKQLSQTR